MGSQKAVIVGLSGCSSSGKTTLARLLRDIFPNTFILHEDDFYKPEEQLPRLHDLVDWDSPNSISIPDLEQALLHIRSAGSFPPNINSYQDGNSVGDCPVSDERIAAMKAKVQKWLQPGQPGHRLSDGDELNICLLDGFLLYCPQMASIMKLLDIKLFLLVSHAKAKERREARDGYVTLEGFWKDPPGYVDKIVWPNYVEAHRWLFKEGNVEGDLNQDVLSESQIKAQVGQGLDVPMDVTLEWAVDTVMTSLEGLLQRPSGGAEPGN